MIDGRRFCRGFVMGTLAAVVGGDAIAFLLTMHDRFSVADFHLWYFMGIGVSFFFYAVYILVINILFNHGKIKDEKTYGRFDTAAIALFEEKGMERYLKTY